MNYHDKPQVSATQLKLIDAEGWRTYEGRYITHTIPERERTAALDWGNVLETIMLEPSRVDSVVFVGPSKDDYDGLLVTDADLKAYAQNYAIDIKGATLKAAKIKAIQAAGHAPPIWDVICQEAEEARGDRIQITRDQYEDALEIVAMARQDVNAQWLFHEGREVQAERYWTHEPSGLACRGKADVWIPKRKILLDVKTTRHASVEAIKRDFLSLGYWLQDLHYSEGFEANHFYFIAVTSARPWRIFTIEFTPYERVRFARYREALLIELGRRTAANDWREDTEGVIIPAAAPEWWHKAKGERYGE